MSDDLELINIKIEKLQADADPETNRLGSFERTAQLQRLYLAREKAQEAQFKKAFPSKKPQKRTKKEAAR